MPPHADNTHGLRRAARRAAVVAAGGLLICAGSVMVASQLESLARQLDSESHAALNEVAVRLRDLQRVRNRSFRLLAQTDFRQPTSDQRLVGRRL